ncbi:MAG TPA: hypothetical protein VF756_13025 [Thermoanaerobaculia bacterium]
MRDLTKSALSLSWAMPLYGTQQLLNLLAPAGERQKFTGGLDAVTGAMAGQLGDNNWLKQLYQLGQCLQNAAVTMGPGLLSPQLFDPMIWLNASVDAAQRSAVTARLIAEGNGGLAWEEIRFKGEVFCLVLDVAKLIGVPATLPFPLYELLERSYALGPFRALWAVEGLGHDYGDSFWNHGMTPHHILNDERTSALPDKSLTMLHAGIGLSIAQHLLSDATPQTPFAQVCDTVRRIVELDVDNSRPGYLGCAVESLGLVTRTFHPELTQTIDRAVQEVSPESRGYFWHGAGRAIYFGPINFLPGSDGLLFEQVRQEAPDEQARLSAVAGAAWGYTLVSQRDPSILAELLISPYGDELARDGAFANGVASSTVMRFDTTPHAPFLEPFRNYQPDPSNRRLVELWDRLVRGPFTAALDVYYPMIKASGRLGEVFEYRDLPAFVAQLQREGQGGRGAA